VANKLLFWMELGAVCLSWHTLEIYLIVWNIELMKSLVVTIAKVFRPFASQLYFQPNSDFGENTPHLRWAEI